MLHMQQRIGREDVRPTPVPGASPEAPFTSDAFRGEAWLPPTGIPSRPNPATNPNDPITMGDKSPKSVNKQSKQKQAKAAGAEQKKQQAIAAQKAAGKNR